MLGFPTILQHIENQKINKAERATQKAIERGREAMSRGRPHGMPMGMSSVSMPESEPMLCGIPVYKIEEVLLNNQEEIKLFGLSAENILTFFEYYKMKNGSSHITLDSIVEAFEGGENPSIKIKSLGTQHDKL